MLRTLFVIGLFTLAGLFALKVVFGILPAVLGLIFGIIWTAAKIALLGAAVYFVIRIVSPDTARRLRERWSGGSMTTY
ncbi:MAG: hypothetical protein MUE41_06695 [Gemmatimonadaceae bacterium]|jgi:hypothetical protein|nr:hypothetical protein [Gemmatimonadaceae bacterium]